MKTIIVRLIGCCLAPVAILLGLAAMMFKFDTFDEYRAVQKLDVFVGFLFAVAIVLITIPETPTGRPKISWRAIVLALSMWVVAAGLLLVLHKTILQIRNPNTPHSLTRMRVDCAQHELKRYAEDCGAYPTQEQGLAVLYQNPGDPKWKGPYLPAEALIDLWGNPLQYSVQGTKVQVWSCGPDGQSGTDDDIHVPFPR